MDFVSIEQEVIEWGIKRGIYKESSPINQVDKLKEEFKELDSATQMYDLEEIKDGIGDMLVVLTHIANMYNFTLTQCYKHAYNQIKNRTGKMVNGIFVKD